MRVERRPELILLTLGGELDLSTTDMLEAHLRRAERSGTPTIVIDLQRLSFIDSTGVGLLVSAQRRAETKGHRLAVLPGPRIVQKVFEVTGLDRLLEFLPGGLDDLEAEPGVA